MKVLQNHTRSTDYMIQFVKSPLCTPPRICECKACKLGLFQPLRMPMGAYEKVHSKLFPLQIPQAQSDESGELRYLSLEDTMKLPFTDEHQPSKKSKTAAAVEKDSSTIGATPPATRGRGRGRSRGRGRGRRGRSAPVPAAAPVCVAPPISSTFQKTPNRSFPLGVVLRLRGLVHCKECQKPRGIYSQQAVQNMKPIAAEYTAEEARECIGIAEQALADAANSEIFMCGMQPLDEGSPCHAIFQCDPNLTCATPVESDFYSTLARTVVVAEGHQRDLNMCAICAGTSHDDKGGQVDSTLKTIFSVVLPICSICKSQGAKTLVGRYKPNGKEIEKRLDQKNRAEAAVAAAATRSDA